MSMNGNDKITSLINMNVKENNLDLIKKTRIMNMSVMEWIRILVNMNGIESITSLLNVNGLEWIMSFKLDEHK